MMEGTAGLRLVYIQKNVSGLSSARYLLNKNPNFKIVVVVVVVVVVTVIVIVIVIVVVVVVVVFHVYNFLPFVVIEPV